LLHVVGDAMAERVLSLMEEMAPAERWGPLRVRIEHGNGIVGPRIARAQRLGIVIAQPRPSSPLSEWFAAGIPVAYGSDMGLPPFEAFARMTDPANPNSVSRETGLAILTRWPAYAEFAEDHKGTLAPGMVADLAVLSQDPMTAPQAQLPMTRSLLTIVNGDIAHSSEPFTSLARAQDNRGTRQH
jgi:predicted amidohydrolase YtcJ